MEEEEVAAALLIAFLVGVVVGVGFEAYCNVRQERQRRLRHVQLGLRATLRTGRHVETYHDVEEFLESLEVN
jgi:hypothetical protein